MKILVGNTKDFEIGTQKNIDFGDDYVLIIRSNSGFYAIEDCCSHDENELMGGEVIDNKIKCPRHGSWFDLNTGKPLNLPAFRPIKSYKVILENDEIYIEDKI